MLWKFTSQIFDVDNRGVVKYFLKVTKLSMLFVGFILLNDYVYIFMKIGKVLTREICLKVNDYVLRQ